MLNQHKIPNLNLTQTLNSGQTFAWETQDDLYIGSFANSAMIVKQINDTLYWQTYPEKDNFEFFLNYFNLNSDHEKAIQEISQDKKIQPAINTYRDIRILNQDFEQTMLSFILASNKNIKAIKKSLNYFQKQYNNVISADGIKIKLFPKAEFFHDLSLEHYKPSGVGYRAKYLMHAAENLVNQNILKHLDEDNQRQELTKIHGIGEKVADCIMTFALKYKDITPIDIWTERVVKNIYHNNKSKNYKQIRRWFRRKFGINTALAGQILFEYIRNAKFP